MAETITRQLREPFVESAGLAVTNEGLRLLNQALPTSTYTGRSFVADQSGLEAGAAKAAAELGHVRVRRAAAVNARLAVWLSKALHAGGHHDCVSLETLLPSLPHFTTPCPSRCLHAGG